MVLAGPDSFCQAYTLRLTSLTRPSTSRTHAGCRRTASIVLAVEQRTRLRRIGRSIAAATGRFAFQRACRDRREITPEPQEKCGIDVGATAMGATDCASGCQWQRSNGTGQGSPGTARQSSAPRCASSERRAVCKLLLTLSCGNHHRL